MTLRAKLLSLVLFVGVVPLLVYSVTALRTHQAAYSARVASEQRRAAEHGAALLGQRLDASERSIAPFAQRVVRWAELRPDERDAALWLLYRQSDEIALAALLDGDGKVLHAALRPPGDASPDLTAHPRISPESAGRLLAALPAGGGRGGFTTGDGGPFVSLSFPVEDTAGWRVAVAVTLRPACATALRGAAPGAEALLVTVTGTLLCGTPGATVEPALADAVAAKRRDLRHESSRGEVFASIAPLGDAAVVVREPVAQAFAASRALRAQAGLWIAIALAIAGTSGWLLSRDIQEGITRLVRGAIELGRGNVSHRIPAEGRDELAHLARTFNHMGAEIEKRDTEIRAWNKELQERVDSRTEDLRLAHQQLLQHQKLVAVASLGAGVAHEINGPLAGLLGLTQVLRTRVAKAGDAGAEELVRSIEQNADRLRRVVQDFVAVTQDFAGDRFVRVPVQEIVDAALATLAGEISQAGVEVVRAYDAAAPEVYASREELREMFVQVARNARIAMQSNAERPRRLEVSITTAEDGQLVRVTIRDTGRGIPAENLSRVFDPFFTTKQDWTGEGLGLTLAYRVAQGHHGTIRLESRPGEGTSAIITLPAAGRGAHLA